MGMTRASVNRVRGLFAHRGYDPYGLFYTSRPAGHIEAGEIIMLWPKNNNGSCKFCFICVHADRHFGWYNPADLVPVRGYLKPKQSRGKTNGSK